MKLFFSCTIGLILLLPPPALLPQSNDKLSLVAQVTPAGSRFSEITGAGDLAVIGGFSSNSFVWIYDVSNRAKPVLLAAIPISLQSWDVQVHGRYLYIALTDHMEWYDILNPPQPKLVCPLSATRTVAAGVYILRLRAGKFTAARRMVLL